MTTPADLQAILNGPALVAPVGETYQFENPPSIESLCFALLGTSLTLALLVFCMRIYTQWIIFHRFSKDDYFLLISTILYTAFVGISFKALFLGVGTHQWDIRVKDMKDLLYLVWVDEILYGVNIMTVKVSIILQYLRIFHHSRKTTLIYIFCWATLWTIVLFYGVSILLTILACTPIDKFWDPLILTGRCINYWKTNVSTGIFNVVSDFVLLLLPQFEIWKLHISPRKKAAVSGVFFIAFCACITSAVRLYYTIKLNWKGDLSYDIAFQGHTAAAEVSIGILCCSLPVSPKFFQTVVGPKIKYLANGSFWTRSSIFSKNISKHNIEGSSLGSTQSDTINLPIYGTYSTLDERELQALKTKKSFTSSGGGDVSEPDLTDWSGIRMTQEIMVESSIACMDLDLEGQRRATSAKMGW